MALKLLKTLISEHLDEYCSKDLSKPKRRLIATELEQEILRAVCNEGFRIQDKFKVEVTVEELKEGGGRIVPLIKPI